jgi:hypothetical protein
VGNVEFICQVISFGPTQKDYRRGDDELDEDVRVEPAIILANNQKEIELA